MARNIRERRDRNGRSRLYLDKQWPDGSRFRRVMPNRTVAKKTLARIEASIAMGTWPALKKELARAAPTLNPTVKDFCEVFLEDCKRKNTRPDFHEQALSSIKKILGSVRVRDLSRDHARRFVAKRQAEGRAPGTINRGLAVLKGLVSCAIERALIAVDPLKGFPRLREPERALRILSYTEYRSLVDHVTEADRAIGAMVAVAGETGMRKSEALRLMWPDVDVPGRRITVQGKTKSGKARYIPLSDFGAQRLSSLIRHLGCPHVFVQSSGKPWKDPRGPFKSGRDAAGLTWVKGFHDLRHFRATQWLLNGVDVYTVKTLMGHADIHTTARYVHYVQRHARESVEKVAQMEALSWNSQK